METQSANPQIAAVVAAAGLSRRMGSPKQLLPWGSRTVIATVVDTLAAAGAAPVVVVVGHRQDEVKAALAGTPAQTIFNADYATAEMLQSYQLGIQALQDGPCAGALIALGDQPHLPIAILAQIVAAAQATPDRLVIPSYAMRRGHPFFVPRTLWPELLALGAEETLRTLVQRHSAAVEYVAVDTDAILCDMDTPAEFAQLQAGA
jgi:molybdenum cofactor cytidylyltransferase